MTGIPIVLCGDPHGRYDHVNNTLSIQPRAGVVILLGDQSLNEPLSDAMGLALASGWDVRWIVGNHDCDNEDCYTNLAGDMPEADIGGRVIEVGGVRVAGLGGVIRSRVWDGVAAPRFRSPDDMIRSLPHQARWRGGLPLRQRATVFKSTVEDLARQRADVLVCHAAPLPYEFGFAFIGGLAAAMGCRLIVHGHHHRSYEARTQQGIAVRGLAIEECWTLTL